MILSIFVSLLPQPYRRRVVERLHVDPTRGAFLSGLVELVASVVMFVFRYLYFLQHRVGQFAETLVRHNAEDAMGSLAVQWGAGMVSLGEYMIHPLTLLLVYFAFEGLVRMSAALLHGDQEIVPTLPLQLIAWAHAGLARAKRHRELGPLVEDSIQQDGISPILRIATCRPKPWNGLTTIAYGKKLYEVATQEDGTAPRPYVYVLRPRPEHKVIRGLYEYDPQELLRESGPEP